MTGDGAGPDLRWLGWVQRLQAVSQAGLTYARDPYAQERYRALLEGRWSLPGGWADVGDSPSEVARREVLEESGYEVVPVKLLAVYDKARHGHPPTRFATYKLCFRCDLTGGAPQTGVEADRVASFGEDDLPPLSATRVTVSQLRRMFEHYRNPDLPADFD